MKGDLIVDLIVAGGEMDPNIGIIADAARTIGYKVVTCRFGEDEEPGIQWVPSERRIHLRGTPLKTRAAFLRHDVFSFSPGNDGALDRAVAWQSAMMGAVLSDDRIKLFNRNIDQRSASKPAMLSLAARLGLCIPNTIVTNLQATIEDFGPSDRKIAKPVAGGAYCFALDEAMLHTPWQSGVAPVPAIVQDKLSYPEYRVYIIGSEIIAFRIDAEVLDYRTATKASIRRAQNTEFPAAVAESLLRLALVVGVDFGAADFKTDTDTGELCFLELNNQPMFVAHDRACSGALANTIVRTLVSS